MEIDFPRGGDVALPSSAVSPLKRKRGKVNPSLSPGDGETEVGVTAPSTKPRADSAWSKKLTVELATSGTLVLGCVRKVLDDRLVLDLPDGLTGMVRIWSLSTEYTASLKTPRSEEEIALLPELYQPGDYLAMKVLGSKKIGPSNVVLEGSADPRGINEGLVVGALRDALIISATVESIEDKGYVMNLGLSSVKGFLKSDRAQSYLTSKYHNFHQTKTFREQLSIGETLLCRMVDVEDHRAGDQGIKPGEQRVVQLTTEKPSKSQPDYEPLSVDHLLPGMTLQGIVRMITPKGVSLRFDSIGGLNGFLPRGKLTKIGKDTLDLTVGEILRVIVTYVKPKTKMIGFSAQKHLVQLYNADRAALSSIDVGEMLDAEAIDSSPTGGIYFKMPTIALIEISKKAKVLFGYAPKSQLRGKGAGGSNPDENRVKVVGKYRKGSKHSVRIVGLNYFDNLCYVSTKKSVLRQSFVNIDDATPGIVVKCTVETAKKSGVLVKIFGHISGFIHKLHSADVPVSSLGARFEPGAVLSCRVLSRDRDHKRLLLTNKQSLVRSDLEILDSLEKASSSAGEATVLYDGVVVNIKSTGLLLLFYNDVKAWVSQASLASSGIEDLSTAFYLGQILRVFVTQVDVENDRIHAALPSSAPADGDAFVGVGAVKENDHRNQPVSGPYKFALNSIVATKITGIVKGKGIYVDILPPSSENSAPMEDANFGVGFVPENQLSQTKALSRQLLITMKPKQILDNCAYFCDGKIIRLTRVPSIVDRAKDGRHIPSFDSLERGCRVSGIITSKHPRYGYFVEVPGNLIGLLPFDHVCSTRDVDQADSTEVEKISVKCPNLEVGEAVEAIVSNVDFERKRFALSLRREAVLPGCSKVMGVEILRSNLSALQQILLWRSSSKDGSERHLAEHTVGKRVEGKLHGDSGKITLFNGAEARFIGEIEDFGGKASGQTAAGIVNDYDFEANQVLISPIDLGSADQLTHKCKVGQKLKAKILRICKEWILVGLFRNNSSKNQISTIGYLPAQFYPGDLEEMILRNVGDLLEVQVTEIFGNCTPIVESIQNLEIIEMFSKKKSVDRLSHKVQRQKVHSRKSDPIPKIAVGGCYYGTVSKIGDLSIRILIGEFHVGNLHISEIDDYYDDRHEPIKRFQLGQKLFVKVVSFRTVLSEKSRRKRVCNCTLRPSKVSPKSKNNKVALLPVTNFSKSDQVAAFISKISKDFCTLAINKLWTGKIETLKLLDPTKDLIDISNNLRIGMAFNLIVDQVYEKNQSVIFDRQNLRVDLRTVNGNEFKPCQIIANVDKIDSAGGTINLTLADSLKGVVFVTDIVDDFDLVPNKLRSITVDSFIRAKVLQPANRDCTRFICSIRDSDVNDGDDDRILPRDRRVIGLDGLREGEGFRGFVKRVTSGGISVRLGSDVIVHVDRSGSSTSSQPEPVCTPGQLVNVEVLCVEPSLECAIVTPASASHQNSSLSRKRTVSDVESAGGSKKKRIRKSIVERDATTYAPALDGDHVTHRDSQSSLVCADEMEGVQVVPSLEEIVSRAPSDSILPTIVKRRRLTETAAPKTIAEERDWIQNSSDSAGCDKECLEMPPGENLFRLDSTTFSKERLMKIGMNLNLDEDNDPKTPESSDGAGAKSSTRKDGTKKTKELLKASKKSKLSEAVSEAAIYKKEMELLNPAKTLEASEDFDRALLSAPDSSRVWIQYMAYFLEKSQIEQARAVAERALRTIPPDQENERLNVWTALLNLENLYGTPETLDGVFQRAVKTNDPLRVHTALADILCRTGKNEAANELFEEKMLRKFKSNVDVWLMALQHLMRSAQVEEARAMMQRSLKSLQPKEHIMVTSRFAQWEFQFGDQERGRTLFENILGSYPRRMDVWSVYIDMVVKHGDASQARPLFERILALKMPLKPVKSFYKKWLDFEEKFGDENSRIYVKERALQYANSLRAV